MDRRTTIKWMLAAAGSTPALNASSWAGQPAAPITPDARAARGYGTDPNLLKIYQPGVLWPLTFTVAQRQLAAALSDLIIPADAHSPSASQVGVVDFLDEWVSAPYELQRQDRGIVLAGFAWIDAQSNERFAKSFALLTEAQQRAICDDICYLPKAKSRFTVGATFFSRYRDLTAGGFYTTPAGRKDLQYVGNTPMATFEGPPPQVLRQVGLAE